MASYSSSARRHGTLGGVISIMSKSREVQDDYQALKDALEVWFGKMEHRTSARHQLSYLRQEEGE